MAANDEDDPTGADLDLGTGIVEGNRKDSEGAKGFWFRQIWI